VFLLVSGSRERRVWDSNPRGRFPALAVFKSQEVLSRSAVSCHDNPFHQVTDGVAHCAMPRRVASVHGVREQMVST